MGYIDYNYYTDTYKGSAIPETAFGNLIVKVDGLIDMYTFNRIDSSMPYMDKVKMCCCELTELIFKTEQEDTKGIASEKVGEYSVAYTNSEAREKQLSTSTAKIINRWLAMTGLLYRGCN